MSILRTNSFPSVSKRTQNYDKTQFEEDYSHNLIKSIQVLSGIELGVTKVDKNTLLAKWYLLDTDTISKDFTISDYVIVLVGNDFIDSLVTSDGK